MNKLRLRDLREDHDMTLQDVAKVLGTTLQYGAVDKVVSEKQQ